MLLAIADNFLLMQLVPLLRLGWNKLDHKYLATFLVDQNQVVILDIRAPSVPVAEIKGYVDSVWFYFCGLLNLDSFLNLLFMS